MEVKAYLRRLHMAPRKVRLVAGLIRRLPVAEAETQLTFLNKAASEPVMKLLKSAIANATHNHSLDPQKLWVKQCTVDEGMVMKRYRPRAFGRAGTIRKRSSHITLVLTDEPRLDGKTKKTYKPRRKTTKAPPVKPAKAPEVPAAETPETTESQQ